MERPWGFKIPYSQDMWGNIGMLLQHPWLHQVWAVQDHPADTIMHYDTGEWPLHHLASAMYCLYSKIRPVPGL